MGKSLTGEELGRGIVQRKDGRYSARFVNRYGKRLEHYFNDPESAKQWLEQIKQEDQLEIPGIVNEMTVDEWFEYWITHIKGKTVKYNTIRNYKARYDHNIREEIGKLPIADIKPMHCQKILNLMEQNYSYLVMSLTKTTMYNMFQSAMENGMILNNPITKSVKLPKKETRPRRVLTLKEQNHFLDTAQGSLHYYSFLFILQTGLRTGEMTGLKWSDVNFENKTISIQRTMEFRYNEQKFVISDPKTATGKRIVPLTDLALNVLRVKYLEKQANPDIPPEYSEFVFLNQKGIPVKNSTYDSALYSLAKKAGMEKFSMHALRHTFATRCIEAGMKPKTLQMILGHSSLDITMNLYVHVTEEEKNKEITIFEDYFNKTKGIGL